MLISLCTPTMNRLPDLRATMPSRIRAALNGAPAEISIVNYGTDTETDEYIESLHEGNMFIFSKHNAPYYHQAHAYNLAIKQSRGAFFWLMGADVYLSADAILEARKLIAQGYNFLYVSRYRGAIVCERELFEKVGGYDERFEFYGPEDRELELRLLRNGAKRGVLPSHLMNIIRTPPSAKVANYRIRRNHYEHSAVMSEIYRENAENYITRANPQGWGYV